MEKFIVTVKDPATGRDCCQPFICVKDEVANVLESFVCSVVIFASAQDFETIKDRIKNENKER